MTSTKQQKEKPHVAASSPRLTPRPTAASAARAARNATNRTLIAPTVQRQSPSRTSPPSPSLKKKSSMFHKTPSRAESRTEIKDKPECESELLDSPSTQILVDRSDEHEEGGQVQPENEPDYNNDVLPTEENHRNTNDLADNVGKSYTGYQGVAHTEKTSHQIEEEGSLIESATRSANTPAVSRPQTPKSTSSRPMTPVARPLSRPGTPVCASMAKRHGTPASRPSTPVPPPPPRALPAPSTRPNTIPTTTPRPPTPTKPRPVASTPASQLSSSAQHLDEGDIKATFSAKQRQFQRMKKELDLKQQAVLEVFDSMRVLRERMASEGQPGCGEGAPLQELVVFNVADWTADEVAQLCRDAVTASCSEGAIDFIESIPEENAMNDWDSKILNIPAQFADLCLQAFSARQELIDWIKELVTANQVDNYGEEPLERIAQYNAQGLQLCEALRELKTRSDVAVDAVSNVSKRVCRDQNTLIAVGKALVREVASLRQDLDARAAIINEMRQMRAAADSNAAFEETRRELEEEKAARLATKDKLATTECQLRQTRMRVSKMDRQLREAEASISSLTGTVKTLEDQSRQREVQLEARARKLKESLKTGEMASGQLALQRDALQAEVTDLKNEIEKMTASHKAAISDLNTRLIEITTALEEQRSVTQKEIDLKNYADAALAESRDTIEQLKAKITELENSKHNPELPTEREMDLWAELQATKETLRITEDEVIVCKREKTRFLETLTKIAESDCKVGMQQKLAAELLNKEEILGKMQVQIRELTKNIKLNEQKVIQYEQYVRDLQAHNRAVSNNSETPNCISYQELQQQIMSLRMGLLEAVHRNEELSELLVQKEQQLEQQDKTSRAQARVIKVREELINMLKNKETEQSRELAALQQDLEHRMKIVDEVNKQIAAKAEEIQELFSTLESKQQQIHRLEKIVLALEEQQRRAQAQRTRHEEKIAALEHELAGGGRRERKFLFF